MKQKRIIFGRIGNKPEVKNLKDGAKKICILDIAEDIEGEEKPIWHKVVVWDKQAEGCNVILDKGKEVFVQGRVVQKEYQKESGEIKKYEEVYADKIGFVTL